MKGRVAFSPSVTFALRGALLPVGPRHVRAQGAAWQGLWGTDKMEWKSGFPSALFLIAFVNRGREKTTTSAHTHCSPLLRPAPEEFFHFFFFFLFCLSCYILKSSSKFPDNRSLSVQDYNNIWMTVIVPRPL